ncbi:5-hydroxyisourate hydrolase [hydrothermal vent metagenome]|uniref:hydroxyisourate hydrolase n=1 Tax=hydrothermal vent metagenome TaxID=652676 RepID=A0A3B0U791_9ZZZZ
MAGHGRLTTHVLDTANGKPAAGMGIGLFFIESIDAGDEDEEVALLVETVTNADGRCDGALLEGEEMVPGVYELLFQVGDYFKALGVEDQYPAFLDQVPVRFGISNTSAHYHVPLLVSPFAYSTYRGS